MEEGKERGRLQGSVQQAWTDSSGRYSAELYTWRPIIIYKSRNTSRFAVNNFFIVAFWSKSNHVSRSRVAVNGITVIPLPYLKIKTRLTNEKFVSVKGECEI